MKCNDLVDKFLTTIKYDLWLFIPIFTMKLCEWNSFPLALNQGARLGQRPWLDYMSVVIQVFDDLVWAANLQIYGPF